MRAMKALQDLVAIGGVKPVEMLRTIWETTFLKAILLTCLTVALLLPMYNWFFLSPAYRQMLASIKEKDAQSVAGHIVRMLGIDRQAISAPLLQKGLAADIETIRDEFGLEKIKLFDPFGKVVFSTDSQDIGRMNVEAYFTGRVAKGKIHSVVVRKGERTLEGRIVDRDVVEVYIPLLADETFQGAFEIYYDITGLRNSLNDLLRRSNIVMVVIALSMMTIVAITLYKAGNTLLMHKHMDEALQAAHGDLENRVRERTHDLIRANKELQMEILERRQVVDALKQSEERFRTLIETIPHGIVEIDASGAITFANPAFMKMYGYPDSGLTGASLFDLAVDDHGRDQLREHLAFLVKHQPFPNPWFSRDFTKDRRVIETQVDWHYKRDEKQQVVGFVAIISEITHRKQAEKALLENVNFLNTLIDTIPNPVFFKDAQGYFLGCNKAYSRATGLTKDRIMGLRLIDLPDIPFKEMAEHFHRQDLWLIENPGVYTHEERFRCADGILRDYLLFEATFQDTEGDVAGLVGILLDITERKQVEKQLKESKALFDGFMRHIPGLAYLKNPKGRYLFVNEAFVQFTGTQAEKVIGLGDDQLWDADTARNLRLNDQNVLEKQVAANVMETVLLPSGQARHLLTARFPILQDNSIHALGGVSIDITERTLAEQQRQQLELQLQQAHKMEALGTLAGGIAHDFNNILAAIIGYTEIVVVETQKQDPNYHYLVRILEAGERARALVKQILAFSRQSEIELKPVQVKVIVKEVLKLLRASLPVTIRIVQQINSDAAVMADPVQIHQVMMNLCTNAGYAMRGKEGALTVTLDEQIVDQPSESRKPDLIPGRYVKLTVSDTGVGIADDALNRIFDPFFTTKPKGEGTGMGLSVVHGIVTSLGGAVNVESSPGRGARFNVYLPVIEEEARVGVVEMASLPVGNENILFIDDEVLQTDMLKHMLGLLGYKVRVSNQGADALALFKTDPMAFDLVITDMLMPGMTGDVLAEQLLSIRPDLPIILCTGYSENINEVKVREMGLRAFALKPLVMEELARLIRQVLDSSDSKDVVFV